MTRTRLVARTGLMGAALAFVGTFVGAAPAGADPAIRIDSPATGATITGSSSVPVTGHVEADFLAEIAEVRYEILRGGTPVDGDATAGADFDFTATLPSNGLYTLVVTATQRGVVNLGEGDFEARRDFAMAVPPSPPTGLIASFADGRVHLAWTGPGHPDLRGYAISRSGGTAAAHFVGVTLAGVTTFTDPSPPPGPVQYRVVALRNGAVASNDPDEWLVSAPSAAASVSVPVPPSAPGDTTTTLPPGGGSQTGDATNVSIGELFSTAPSSLPSVQTMPTPTLPDTGFSQTLPFGVSEPGEDGKVDGRAPGRPASASASGELSAGDSDGSTTNRRALLVPVAAGSVLCVAALHLRWLNRRLAMPSAVAGGGDGMGPGDLEPADLEPADVEPDARGDDRLPVGAGK